MAPRGALREIFQDPARAQERRFLIVLVVQIFMIFGILADTVTTLSVIMINDRRITRSQLQILDISQKVELSTEKLRLLDEQHYTNLLQFRTLAAQLNAVRQTLAVTSGKKNR